MQNNKQQEFLFESASSEYINTLKQIYNRNLYRIQSIESELRELKQEQIKIEKKLSESESNDLFVG